MTIKNRALRKVFAVMTLLAFAFLCYVIFYA